MMCGFLLVCVPFQYILFLSFNRTLYWFLFQCILLLSFNRTLHWMYFCLSTIYLIGYFKSVSSVSPSPVCKLVADKHYRNNIYNLQSVPKCCNKQSTPQLRILYTAAGDNKQTHKTHKKLFFCFFSTLFRSTYHQC